ncbi:GntR family transcriptional regulator [Paenisporosarcina antarctica]|uniref:GntR family transcriptional regulator n=1 Tax=Paenisporosarcina antarctica TaxID=417367 RepID=A0A4P7A1Q3_9BACL|nr:GntR family transcriptional regulator [Paenisporosarcina antarctica]QBP42792.1 GntR family transcriptional regulator [Paenisporosarcina antarctica]
MSIDFLPDKPIYQQLMERISGDIIKGIVKPGDKLPSVRDYAVEAGVNANTMQRVYRELELVGITETKRGQGTFVTKDEIKLKELRKDMKETLIASFIHHAEGLGFSKQEMIESLQIRKGGE